MIESVWFSCIVYKRRTAYFAQDVFAFEEIAVSSAAQSPGGADGAGDETRDRASAARQMRSRSLVARPGVKG